MPTLSVNGQLGAFFKYCSYLNVTRNWKYSVTETKVGKF